MAIYPVFTVNAGQAAGAAATAIQRANPVVQRIYPWLIIAMTLPSFIPIFGFVWAFFIILLFSALLIGSSVRRRYMERNAANYREDQLDTKDYEHAIHSRNIKVFIAGLIIVFVSFFVQMLFIIVGVMLEA